MVITLHCLVCLICTKEMPVTQNRMAHSIVVKAVPTSVSICEMNCFNQFQIKGVDVADFLDRTNCSRLMRKAGRLGLLYFLNHDGMVKVEATIADIPASDRAPTGIGTALPQRQNYMTWTG